MTEPVLQEGIIGSLHGCCTTSAGIVMVATSVRNRAIALKRILMGTPVGQLTIILKLPIVTLTGIGELRVAGTTAYYDPARNNYQT